jgi:hypothetical protein
MRSDFGETDNAASAWFWPFHDQPGCAMSPQQRMSPTEWGLLALLSLLWGGSFFFAKIAVGALPPLTVNLLYEYDIRLLPCFNAPFRIHSGECCCLGSSARPDCRRLCDGRDLGSFRTYIARPSYRFCLYFSQLA